MECVHLLHKFSNLGIRLDKLVYIDFHAVISFSHIDFENSAL